MQSAHKKTIRTAFRVTVLLAVLAVPYCTFIYNPFPSDAAMVTHFKAHRTDFEFLQEKYRNYDAGKKGYHSKWADQPGVQEAMQNARVEHIFRTAYSPWLKDPYSIASAKKIREILRRGEYYKVRHKYSDLIIKPTPRWDYRANNLYYLITWKDYAYFPTPPRVVDSEILWPVDTRGKASPQRRVVESLDRPINWERFSCVFRRIEPRWFLRVCSAH